MSRFSRISDALERHQRHMVATDASIYGPCAVAGRPRMRLRCWCQTPNIVEVKIDVHLTCGFCWGTMKRLEAASMRFDVDDLDAIAAAIFQASDG
jgi:hypothetical protein